MRPVRLAYACAVPRCNASAMAYTDCYEAGQEQEGISIVKGSFDFREYAIVHSCMFNDPKLPVLKVESDGLIFNTAFVNRFRTEYVELLVHPGKKQFAVRPCKQDNKNCVKCSRPDGSGYTNKKVSGRAFIKVLYQLFGWNEKCCYKIRGSFFEDAEQSAMIFNAWEASVVIPSTAEPVENEQGRTTRPAVRSGQKAVGLPIPPGKFGNGFYEEMSYARLSSQTKEDWKIRVEGELVKTGMQLNVTDFDTLKAFITRELGDWRPEE